MSLVAKVDEFLAAHEDGDGVVGHLTIDAISIAESKISHWRRAYPDWPEGDLWEVRELAALAARRYYIDATPLNRARAATALIASYFANGRTVSFDELTPSGGSARADTRREVLIDDTIRRLGRLADVNHFGPEVYRLIE